MPALGHVHLTVSDLDRAVDFYETYLDLDVRERVDRFAFLSWGEAHHDLALREVRDATPAPPGSAGLYHVAFEVEDAAALRSTYRRLRADGVPVTAVDHDISEALYFDDPDGNGVEVYLDTRATGDERWGGASRPFDPETP
ncbi:VOC family protein [Salinilacihabitans rarus]|uniref:VOC family protein n=1 Tax=Salinilacihabitans rarus TaxID=2961596 RepID=UPI0020C8ECCF|nr:VOC family protein [Salinilacihabitans rarus]